jgi:hypothetical protein
MALPDVYVQVYGQLPEVFRRISDGQAPEKFTRQYVKDLGFHSSNFHALIPLLKSLGFLSSDGVPTARYHAYRDQSQARGVMAEALREAYSELFTIKAEPTDADRALIEGKFKSVHNTGDRVAKLMASTFLALLALADLKSTSTPQAKEAKVETTSARDHSPPEERRSTSHRSTLHYNIQIHLPSTKDVEVFNAIFKSLREHLLD